MDTFIDFVKKSPTAWHACEQAKQFLKRAHFKELDERKPWKMEPGGGYFVQRGASLAAFLMPHEKMEDAAIFTSHTDSPTLRLRPYGESVKEGHSLLHFEVYGAPILPSWLGRAVNLAGKIYVQGKNGTIEEKLIDLKEHPFVFPYAAFHLDRQVNDSFSVNKQMHLIAIAGKGTAGVLEKWLQPYGKVLHHELYCIPAAEPCCLEDGLILASRLDNLVSFYASMQAIVLSKCKKKRLVMSIGWNHEEVGSETSEGAVSNFYSSIMERLVEKLKMTRDEQRCAEASSFVLSVDVAHAWHPNFPEKSVSTDPVMLGDGVVIKINAQQRYMSDGSVVARFASMAEQNAIPVRFYSHRNDIACGSTVGPIQSAISGIKTMDIGTPLLSMHAAEELVQGKDIEHLIDALKLSAEEVHL